VLAEVVNEGVKYSDCQTLASRDGLNTKARVNQIPYTGRTFSIFCGLLNSMWETAAYWIMVGHLPLSSVVFVELAQQVRTVRILGPKVGSAKMKARRSEAGRQSRCLKIAN